MKKVSEEKMYAVIRERFNELSDHVYKVCNRDKAWLSNLPDEEYRAKCLHNDQCEVRRLYGRFMDAVNLFADCEMLSCDEFLDYAHAGEMAQLEGNVAISHFYKGRRWYEESYFESYPYKLKNYLKNY